MTQLPMTRSAESATTLAWLAGRDLIPTVAWHDPQVTTGFDPSDTYVETYWLPLLGPSSTWALRRIGCWLNDAAASGLWLPIEPLARSLGLGTADGRHARARRAISRLVDFGLAHVDTDRDVLAVRTLIPALTERALRGLPGHLVVQHRADHPTVATAGSPVVAGRARDREAPPRSGDLDGQTRPIRSGLTIGLSTDRSGLSTTEVRTSNLQLDTEGALR